jgi:magnesium chelatase subunit I
MIQPYPFAALVAQEEMKRGLILAAIDPSIGGVLIFGDRGTGKSTAVRGLADLLPPMKAVAGCRYNCEAAIEGGSCPHCGPGVASSATHPRPVPVIDLPLGASEDRVTGALDIEKALVDGRKVFEPGLLASAHRGFLYVDEVNLLEDHLVDLLLDVSASGWNVVEREGLSIRHPARFVLVGSGNPEEGELRPQLLDRFGLSVDVSSPKDIKTRIEVVRRRDDYERDPASFVKRFARQTGALRSRIKAARQAVAQVTVSDAMLELATTLCLRLGIDGLRGELTLMRAARALAAYEQRAAVTSDLLLAVAPSTLRHRLRRDPLDEAGSSVRVERAIASLIAA